MKKRILVVEDESIVAEDIRSLLLKNDYQVPEIAFSGEDAIRSVKKNKPDLIVMDIILETKMTGIEAAKVIRHKFNIPVIFLTAHCDDKTILEAISSTPYGYLIKPFDERELLTTIKIALNKYQMEKAIKDSKVRYKTLIETMDEGLVIVDKEENFTFANPAASKIFAHSINDLCSMNLQDFLRENDFLKVIENTKMRKNGISNSYDIKMHLRDGTQKLLKIKASPLIIDGDYIGTFGLISDITKDTQIDISLRELKQAVQTMQLGVTISDINGKIFFTNPADARMHGYRAEELIGKDVRSFAPVEIRKPFSLEQVKRWRGLVRESTNIRKDGSIFPVRLISDVVRDVNDLPVAIVTTCEDITERKEAEKALRDSEERFRSTFFHAAAGMIIVQPDGKIKQVNQSFCEMIGYSEETLLKMSLNDLTHPEDINNCLSNIRNMLSGKLDYFHLEERYIHKNGNVIWVNVSVSSVSDDFGQSVYLIVQILDISEMRKAEEEIMELNRQLEGRVRIELKKRLQQQQLLIQKSKLESLGKLAAGIAHEINQPLAGISMAIDNILFKQTSNKITPEYLQTKLESIFQDIDRIRHIINHVRIFSRDQKSVVFEKVDVNESIENALSMVKAQYKNHNIQLTLNLDDDCGFTLGNKYKLEQVVLNLLNNAKDALEERDSEISNPGFQKKITIKTAGIGEKVFITVEDNGTGISDDKIENIFDPFYTTKDPEKGTGLGLSIIYGIIKELKGDISVQSEVNKYTRFKVELPKLSN